ncbi:response regulator [Planctomicrobium sp. SH664]|uniref:response regulator n=1 Tax=Planctomicrobium sp. SH664 TaxID=3448125 RepID=UPI003F5BAE01
MQATRLDGLHVLFVDDRRDARYVVQHILKDAGAAVTALTDGQQAVEAVLANTPFDVVVLDVNMPVMDGLTATRRLREQGYRAPILALTSGILDADREACLAAGFDDYLRKPIDGIRLVKMVRELARSGENVGN